MGWFETREAKARRLAARESEMVEALLRDDAKSALALSQAGVGLGKVRGLGWSSMMPSEPVLALAIRWGSQACVAALVEEARRSGAAGELMDPGLMETAMLGGQVEMAKALRAAGAPGPTMAQLAKVLEKARASEGRAVRNKPGVREIRRREADRRPWGRWGDLLDPVSEWAAQELGRSGELEGRAGADALGAAGSGRRARALLMAGANPNQADGQGVWPLERAIAAGKKEWIEALIEGGADPSFLGPSGGMGEAAARAGRPKALDWGREALRQSVAPALEPPGPGAAVKGAPRRL